MDGPQLPNALTVLRILVVPVMVVALLAETRTGDYVGGAIFALASATDYLDGWLARRSDTISRFGKLMDPFADKLLVGSALVCLVIVDRLAAWVAVVVIVREAAVTISRTLASGQGVVVAAAMWGKVKTCVQVLAVLLVILVAGSPTWLDLLIYLMVVVTILSGLDYARGVRRLLRDGEGAHAPGAVS